jgi:putative ABC transport system substrate-binding protein
MNRRDFIAGLGGMAIALPRVAAAQPTTRIPKIGVLWHAGNAEEEGPYFSAVKEGFKDLGYIEGRTISLEHRFPNEEPAKFASMALELVALRPDVLLAAGGPASIAAKNATATIPVVFIAVPDPILSKLVDNLSRPSGNVTGLSNFAVQVAAKRLEYLKAAMPSLARIALLVNPNVPIARRYIEESQEAAEKLRLNVQPFEARSLQEIDTAFGAMVKARMQAVSINAEGVFFQHRGMIGKIAITHRLPTCAFSRETLEGGALMSYGPDQRALFRRAATLADKLLKGAKPSDLPVEQPTRIEFLINGKTAKALGFTFPRELLLRADEVIE